MSSRVTSECISPRQDRPACERATSRAERHDAELLGVRERARWAVPASYTGPRGTREYFGFQWHVADVDVAAIEAAARWLAKG